MDNKETSDDEMDCDHSDVEDSEAKRDEEKVCWLGDEEEMKMDANHVEEEGDDNRPLFNPASLTNKSFSYVPYPKNEFKDTAMIFWTLQVKPKAMNGELVQMFYW